jgi:hypothetical protein
MEFPSSAQNPDSGPQGPADNLHRLSCGAKGECIEGRFLWQRAPLAGMATRLIKEVRGVNGVVYDVTAKPPRTIASHVIARRPL